MRMSIAEQILADLKSETKIGYHKEFGLEGKKTVTVEGPYSAVTAGLCELVTEAIKRNPDRIMQVFTLELLYDEVKRELGFSKE